MMRSVIVIIIKRIYMMMITTTQAISLCTALLMAEALKQASNQS